MSIKAVILDLDGTLVNSIGGIAASMNRVLIDNNLPERSLEDYSSFIGNGRRELVRLAASLDPTDTIRIDTLFTSMGKEYDSLWNFDMSLYSGISELLNELTAKNIQLAINSSREEKSAKLIVKNYLDSWDFRHLICCDTLKSKKPDPEGALYITNSLGLKLKEILYIGDTEVDIETAKTAGIIALGVSWGYRSIEQLNKAGAEHIFDNPIDLISLFC